MGNNFNHIDENGNAVMVDVSDKKKTDRVAVACGTVFVKSSTMEKILDRGIKKGDVLSIAQLAGIMGAKKTPELIPLCHPLSLSSVTVELNCNPKKSSINIVATCKVNGATGVEMEALTGVSISALTVYDMCKAIDKEMRITDIRLLSKSGGKSGYFEA